MPSKRSRRRVWIYTPAREPKPTISEALKQQAQEQADSVLAEFRPRYIELPPAEPRFNYRTELFTRWFRSYLYLCSTYACPDPNALLPSFEVRFTRLEYAGADRFHLAYMRHTGQWQTVYRDLTLADAFRTIRSEGMFHP